MVGGRPSFEQLDFYEYRVLLVGLTYILLGYSLARHKLKPLTGWLYSFGVLGFLGAALALGGWTPNQNMFWEISFPAFSLGAMFVSIYLKSRSFLIFGAIFLMAYLLKITAEYFTDTLGWPLALVLAGLALIGIGFGTFYMKKQADLNSAPFDLSTIKAVIGLGNPGLRYERTRHNIGFRVVDELAARWGLSWQQRAADELHVAAGALLLIKPQTYMNASGDVLSFLTKKGIKPEQIVVVHDELEKKLGHVSMRFGGSARGHNGLRSLISRMGPEFWRLRVGIGRPEHKEDVSQYVLTPFTSQEEEELGILVGRAADLLMADTA